MDEVKELNIYQRMSAVTNEIRRVAKNLNVGVGQSQYKAVGEADVLDAVKPIEEKYGIYSYPCSRKIVGSEILENEGIDKYTKEKVIKRQFFMRVETVYRFVNIDKPDEFIETVTYGDGMDSQDKAPGKAATYADKYALLKAYKIATGDDPDQNASEETKKPVKPTYNKQQTKPTQTEPTTAEPTQADIDKIKSKPISDVQFESIQTELARTGVKAEQICKKYKVAALKVLTLEQWTDAMRNLEKVKTKIPTDLGL